MEKITLKFSPYNYGKDNKYSSSQCFMVVSNEFQVGNVLKFSELKISEEFEAGCLNLKHYNYLSDRQFVVCVGNVLEEIDNKKIEFMFYSAFLGCKTLAECTLLAWTEIGGVKCPDWVLTKIDEFIETI